MKKLKAYEQIDEDGFVLVVFAENRNKAKVALLNTEALQDYDYTDLRPRRVPDLDDEYRGCVEMDWNNSQDRLALVKNGCYCCDDAFDPDDCVDCVGKEWCSRYEDYLDEKAEEGGEK